MTEKFTDYLKRLENSEYPLAQAISDGLILAIQSPASGTMRKWMESHDGQAVHTVQIDNETGTSWSPLGRTIRARGSRVGFADQDGNVSARDYAGMRVLHVTESALIVADDWHTIAYLVA